MRLLLPLLCCYCSRNMRKVRLIKLGKMRENEAESEGEREGVIEWATWPGLYSAYGIWKSFYYNIFFLVSRSYVWRLTIFLFVLLWLTIGCAFSVMILVAWAFVISFFLIIFLTVCMYIICMYQYVFGLTICLNLSYRLSKWAELSDVEN